MPSKYFYDILLVLCCGFALWRGRGDERTAATVCLVASVLSMAVLRFSTVGFHRLEGGLLLIDIVVFASFVAIALWSQRFWPLWVAGFQLTSLLAHMARASRIDLVPVAYAAAERFWSYPILVIIAVGAWRQHRRQLADNNSARPA